MVKLYALVQYPHDEYMHEACMEESPSGTYVHHDDYAALQAENERLLVLIDGQANVRRCSEQCSEVGSKSEGE